MKIGKSGGLNNPLKSTDFATVVSDKKLKGSGLSRGDKVLLLSEKTVPATHKDPYLFRKLMVVAKLVDDFPQLPREGTDTRVFLVDPRNLQWVGQEQQNYLESLINNRSR